ncbi:MAG: hypothetical protein J0I47_15240 [Sphingomonas sp.]|uniref:hypothetical protein n=1 Tax=Sphingomonas sp. TaxID=28214 RepID=UPI001AD5697E|nr:hypothetical protein [Sphingomonas sp.]MBN8809573.1 hypothetical protein [Sphingomonas sp.]
MKPTTLLSLRRWHNYIGVLLAPSILFFSLSGFIQVVGWQDQRDPRPPAWVSWMAGIHKHQAAPKPRAPRPAAPAMPGAQRGGEHDDHDKAFVPLKIVALLTAIGLFVMTLVGLTIALGTRSTRRTATIMVAIGVIVPVVLMLV